MVSETIGKRSHVVSLSTMQRVSCLTACWFVFGSRRPGWRHRQRRHGQAGGGAACLRSPVRTFCARVRELLRVQAVAAGAVVRAALSNAPPKGGGDPPPPPQYSRFPSMCGRAGSGGGEALPTAAGQEAARRRVRRWCGRWGRRRRRRRRRWRRGRRRRQWRWRQRRRPNHFRRSH